MKVRGLQRISSAVTPCLWVSVNKPLLLNSNDVISADKLNFCRKSTSKQTYFNPKTLTNCERL